MNRYLVFSIYVGLFVSTLLVFSQVRHFDFVTYDDDLYVYENPHVLNGLTRDGLISAFTSAPAGGNWLPMTWLSFMLDCQLFNANPGRMHLVNLLLHLVNTLLLFTILRRMTGSLWPSAFVAAVFSLHPLHVESVAWITERKDVLCTLFLLLTIAAYAGYVKRPSVFRYLLTLVLFALGLMAKPMLVTLPFVLLLLDYWPLNRFEIRRPVKSGRRTRKPAPVPDRHSATYRLIIEKIPFAVLSVISSTITFIVQRSGGAMYETDILSIKFRVLNAAVAYLEYINKMFWPSKLAVFYPHPGDNIPVAKAAGCILLLLGLTVLFLYLGRRRKYLTAGWLWYLGTLIPVIGLVQVGGQSMADRYTYIPYIGLFIMIAWGLPELLSKWPPRKIVLGLAATISLAGLGVCAHRQVGYWNNSIALFSHAIKVTQNNALAYNNLGEAYGKLGRFQEMIEACQQALRIRPDYAKAYNNLGAAYGNLGRYQEAIEVLKKATKINPNLAEVYNNLGLAYAKLGRWQEAINYACRACELTNHRNAVFLDALAQAYLSAGRFSEAAQTAEAALKINPNLANAYGTLGVVLASKGSSEKALVHLKRSLEINPDNIGVKNNLAWILATNPDPTLRNPKEAIRLAQEVCSATDSKNPQMLDTLAAAYAAGDRFPEAIRTAEKALKLASDAGQVELKNRIEHLLNFYKQNRPYVESVKELIDDVNKP